MQFKEFISKQRVTIFVIGVVVFVATLLLAHVIGFNSLAGELFVDLAAGAFTIVFTALIIDYLGLKEQFNRTMNATDLAEDEIRVVCTRIKWRMARLFGLKQQALGRDNISNRQEAGQYLDKVTERVDHYLSTVKFDEAETAIEDPAFPKYLERLQASQNELEQTLILYEYALPYSLRECILALRRELQIADRLLGFIDSAESLNEANYSLIKVTAEAIYIAAEDVLAHSTRTVGSTSIHSKGNRLHNDY